MPDRFHFKTIEICLCQLVRFLLDDEVVVNAVFKNISYFFCIETYYKDSGLVWVLAKNGELPGNAIQGGYEKDGTPVYVSRFVTKEGQLSPGKFHQPLGTAYSSWGGIEHSSKIYQVLTHPNQVDALKWVTASNGYLPSGAIRAGGDPGKNDLYIARAPLLGGLCCGKYQPTHKCAYLPFGGKEHPVPICEVLCIASLDF